MFDNIQSCGKRKQVFYFGKEEKISMMIITFKFEKTKSIMTETLAF